MSCIFSTSLFPISSASDFDVSSLSQNKFPFTSRQMTSLFITKNLDQVVSGSPAAPPLPPPVRNCELGCAESQTTTTPTVVTGNPSKQF